MSCSLAKLKKREIHGKKVEFPIQWFTWYTGKPKPWKLTNCEGVFVNAYNLGIEQKKNIKGNILQRGVHEFLELDNEIPIFMDSGGFQFFRRNVIPDINSILNFQLHSNADLIAVVDYPFSPKASTESKLLRMEQTLRNIEIYAKAISEYKTNQAVVPIIHSHNEKIMEKSIKAIRSIEEKYDVDFPIYALGSMVYMVSATLTASFVRYYRLIDLILEARKLLYDKILHVFGVGSPNMMYLLMYIGVDSIETFGWAGHGIHYSTYIAGEGTKALSDRKRSLDSEFDWNSYLCECKVCSGQCPIRNGKCIAYEGKCIVKVEEVKEKYRRWKEAPIKQRAILYNEWINNLRDNVLYTKGGWVPRACHNACVYSEEMKRAKKALKNGEFEDFIKVSMNNSLYRKAKIFDYAKSRILELKINV